MVRSGSFGAGLLGEHLAKANAGGKACAMHLRLWNIKQPGDRRRRIAFDVTQQEQQALVGGQAAHRNLKIGTAHIAMTQVDTRRNNCRRLFLFQWKSLAQLADQCRIHSVTIRLLVLLESANECSRENFFRVHLIAGHVEGEGKSTMTVTFIDIPLLLLTGLFGSLGDDRV